MATKQGMCRNCGSLIVFDDRNENCECIFCHCIFPGEEAVKILENPGDYTFANETFEETSDSTHYYVNKVNPDMVTSAVARQKLAESKDGSLAIKPSEFEISPKDIKAPTKLKMIMLGAFALFVIIVIAVSLPLYKSRVNLTKAIKDGIPQAFSGIAAIDTAIDDHGNAKGYAIYGQSCSNIKLAVTSDVTEKTCEDLFVKYTDLRAQKAEITSDKLKGVTMEVFVKNGVYTVTGSDGSVKVEFAEDVALETTAASETTASATTEAKAAA
ncbi:MAG: hypothetical protein IKH76_04260 [Clostridiales bacterium]|nr:hypothetical protein [Clostridiales bacterium]